MGIKPEETELLTAFEQFWTAEKIQALNALCSEERMNPDELDKLIRSYLFTNRLPLGQEIINALNFQPKILERKPIIARIADKIQQFIDTFIEGMGGVV